MKEVFMEMDSFSVVLYVIYTSVYFKSNIYILKEKWSLLYHFANINKMK